MWMVVDFLWETTMCKIFGIGSFEIEMFDGTVRTLCIMRHVPRLKKELDLFRHVG